MHVLTDVDISNKEEADKLERLFLLHLLLKRGRNMFNHWISEYRPQLFTFIKTLEQYLEMADELAQKAEAQDNR